MHINELNMVHMMRGTYVMVWALLKSGSITNLHRLSQPVALASTSTTRSPGAHSTGTSNGSSFTPGNVIDSVNFICHRQFVSALSW